jgi:hypothetical protein
MEDDCLNKNDKESDHAIVKDDTSSAIPNQNGFIQTGLGHEVVQDVPKVDLPVENSPDLDINDVNQFEKGSMDSDIYVKISLDRDEDNFGDSMNIGDIKLFGKIEPFYHEIEIRYLYYRVSYKNESLQIGDLCTEGFIFVGATEVGSKVFLHFSKLEVNNCDVVSVDANEFFSKENNIRATDKQLSENTFKSKRQEFSASYDIIKGRYESLHEKHTSEEPRYEGSYKISICNVLHSFI